MTQNNTSRMATLLGRLRREMNGAVSESMARGGIQGMLNYGVSLPTIVDIARQQPADYEFAKFLYRQQVRELKISALLIAPPQNLTRQELGFWIDGAATYELADILSLNLLSKSDCLGEAQNLLSSDKPMEAYIAIKWLTSSRERIPDEQLLLPLCRFGDNMMIARAAVAYFLNVVGSQPHFEQKVSTPALDYLKDELRAFFDC